jgi:hypothetical protein
MLQGEKMKSSLVRITRPVNPLERIFSLAVIQFVNFPALKNPN